MTEATVVASTLAFVLFALAMLHVAWAAGVRLGKDVVVPKVQGRKAFTPGRASTLVVAALLFAACAVALLQGDLVQSAVPETPVRWAALAAGTAFLLRAIGEFRLAGFFKRVRDTNFARWDTWLFTPLSALIGSAFWFLALR